MFTHDRFTRILSLSLCFLMCEAVLLSVPFAVSADDELSVVSGKAASFSCTGADTLEAGGKTFKAGGEDASLTFRVKTDDATNAYSVFTLNGDVISSLVNGENVLTICMADLKEGENRLGILLGAGSATYKDTMVYGTYNLDDIAVQSVTVEGISGIAMKLCKWMANVGASGVTYAESAYGGGAFSLGDGWYEATGLGGSMPEMPVAAEILFDKPDLTGLFYVDTTLLPDGKTDFVFKKDGKTVETRTCLVDNTGPEIVFNQKSNAFLYRNDTLDADATDASGKTQRYLYLDGARVTRVRLDKLTPGGHSLRVDAEDKQGNTSSATLLFTLIDRNRMLATDESGNVTGTLNGEALYEADRIDTVLLYENPYGNWNGSALRSSDERLSFFSDDQVTEAAGANYPYQSFVFKADPEKQKSLLVSYTGTTGNGVPIDLYAYRPDQKSWDLIGQAQSGEPFAALIETAPYAMNGTVRVNAIPHAVYNGSDTLLWDSDTQYYTAFEDLFPYYERINEYAADEYKKGNIGYVVHTGDLVDQSDPADEARLEYKRASDAQDILDNAGVPNGVVSGNHDIKHTTADYTYYLEQFSASRYTGFDWYGGQLNDNIHHYDLISLGAYDFLFLYIGCYRETDEDFLSWANAVCKAYPNRNVVLCLHEYLLPSGVFSGDRAQVLWDRLIVPNENVKMVLCGHNEGVCDRWREVEGTDRKVLEILADYQFAENGQGPQHVINSCTCDGEGYIRLMTFTNKGQVISRTYSPVADDYGIDPTHYYADYMDNFTYDVDLIRADRSLRTLSFEVAVPGAQTEPGKTGANALFAKSEKGEVSPLWVLDKAHTAYDIPEHAKLVPDAADKTVRINGRTHIDPALHAGSGRLEDLSFVDVAVDLIPGSTLKLYQTSGSKIFEADFTEDRGLHIHHVYDNANWVILSSSCNQAVDFNTYNRLYFSVTAAPTAKWNLTLTLNNVTYSFSRNAAIAAKFGYLYQLPSDLQGSWHGYVDLSKFVSGNGRINSILFTAATPEQDIVFDYVVLGRSNGGSATFRIGENNAETLEGPVGSTLEPPVPPESATEWFAGWKQEQGTETVQTVTAEKEGVVYVASYTDVAPDPSWTSQKEPASFSDEELPFPEIHTGFPLWAILLIAGGVLLIAIVIVVVILASKKKKEKA